MKLHRSPQHAIWFEKYYSELQEMTSKKTESNYEAKTNVVKYKNGNYISSCSHRLVQKQFCCILCGLSAARMAVEAPNDDIHLVVFTSKTIQKFA